MSHDVVSRLDHPKDPFIFDPDAYDPFDPNAADRAGFDVLLAQTVGRRPGAPLLRVTVSGYACAAVSAAAWTDDPRPLVRDDEPPCRARPSLPSVQPPILALSLVEC